MCQSPACEGGLPAKKVGDISLGWGLGLGGMVEVGDITRVGVGWGGVRWWRRGGGQNIMVRPLLYGHPTLFI